MAESGPLSAIVGTLVPAAALNIEMGEHKVAVTRPVFKYQTGDKTTVAELNRADDPERLFESYELGAEDLSRIREQRDRVVRGYIAVSAVAIG